MGNNDNEETPEAVEAEALEALEAVEKPSKPSKPVPPGMRLAPNGGLLKNGPGPGRPRGSVSLRTVLRKASAKGNVKEELISAFFKQLRAGSAPHWKMYFDQHDGPLKQEIVIDDIRELSDAELIARAESLLRGIIPARDNTEEEF